MAASGSLASRLYRGEVSYDFVGRRRTWYLFSAALIVISLGSLLIRGLSPSIEFKGGAVFEAPANGRSVAEARTVFTANGVTPEVAQKIGEGKLRIQTAAIDPRDPTKTTRLQEAMAKRLGISVNDVAVQQVGPSWGGQITRKAIQGLVVFLVLLFVVLSVRYEMKMAAAAFVALVHDIVITAGIYSLVGFEVSPATVIALLTILGYSLYDTVVVFDKVRENTAGLARGGRMTFSEAANLALNQTLVRSINTSVIGLLPVASLLFIGAGLLKAGTLEDLALALFIGLMAGAYSSIFIATPLLCDLKEREPAMRALARRVESRRAGTAPASSAAAGTAPAGAAAVGGGGRGSRRGSAVAGDEGRRAQPAPGSGRARRSWPGGAEVDGDLDGGLDAGSLDDDGLDDDGLDADSLHADGLDDDGLDAGGRDEDGRRLSAGTGRGRAEPRTETGSRAVAPGEDAVGSGRPAGTGGGQPRPGQRPARRGGRSGRPSGKRRR